MADRVKTCPKCHKVVEDAWTFCPHDGTDLRPGVGKETMPLAKQHLCPKCGAKINNQRVRCKKCAQALTRPKKK